MTHVALTFVKRRKECWPSRDSNSQHLDWQPSSLPTELAGSIVDWKMTYYSLKLYMCSLSFKWSQRNRVLVREFASYRNSFKPTSEIEEPVVAPFYLQIHPSLSHCLHCMSRLRWMFIIVFLFLPQCFQVYSIIIHSNGEISITNKSKYKL